MRKAGSCNIGQPLPQQIDRPLGLQALSIGRRLIKVCKQNVKVGANAGYSRLEFAYVYVSGIWGRLGHFPGQDQEILSVQRPCVAGHLANGICERQNLGKGTHGWAAAATIGKLDLHNSRVITLYLTSEVIAHTAFDFGEAGRLNLLTNEVDEIKRLQTKICETNQGLNRIASFKQYDPVGIYDARSAPDGGRIAQHFPDPVVKGRLGPGPARHGNRRPGIRRQGWIKMNCNAICKAEIRAPGRINHLDLYRKLSAGYGLHHRCRAIKVAERQLIRAFGGQHIAQCVERIFKIFLFFPDDLDLIAIRRWWRKSNARRKIGRSSCDLESVDHLEILDHLSRFRGETLPRYLRSLNRKGLPKHRLELLEDNRAYRPRGPI